MLTLLFSAPAIAGASSPAYRVAGVMIGDSPERVRAAVIAKGYVVTSTQAAPSFRQRLEVERDHQLGRSPVESKPQGIGGMDAMLADQHVHVSFDDDALGQRVAVSVTYAAIAVAHPYARALDALRVLYGAPTMTRPYGAAWCGSAHDCDVGVSSDTDKLEVRAESNLRQDITSIRLDLGADAIRRWRLAHGAALARIMAVPDAF